MFFKSFWSFFFLNSLKIIKSNTFVFFKLTVVWVLSSTVMPVFALRADVQG